MKSLVDTSLLVYRFDPRDPAKQRLAAALLREGVGELVVPHQALIEFFAAVTRPLADLGGQSLMTRKAAVERVERLQSQYPVVWPDAAVLASALHGAVVYGLSWYDAHLWAYAQANGIPEILSEDFDHGRHYGRVRVVNPFLDAVNELPQLFG
ncbi:MAG: PIN domain-containing protein [Xanthomonadaceae bacterium]|nr:PIN domain-containing protein [Xanthomonadaceae bacterium]